MDDKNQQGQAQEQKVKVRVWATKPDGYWALGRQFAFQQKTDMEITRAQLEELKQEYYIGYEVVSGGVAGESSHGGGTEQHATDLVNAPAPRPTGIGGDQEDPKKAGKK